MEVAGGKWRWSGSFLDDMVAHDRHEPYRKKNVK
jgi:hypothetical protein